MVRVQPTADEYAFSDFQLSCGRPSYSSGQCCAVCCRSQWSGRPGRIDRVRGGCSTSCAHPCCCTRPHACACWRHACCTKCRRRLLLVWWAFIRRVRWFGLRWGVACWAESFVSVWCPRTHRPFREPRHPYRPGHPYHWFRGRIDFTCVFTDQHGSCPSIWCACSGSFRSDFFWRARPCCQRIWCCACSGPCSFRRGVRWRCTCVWRSSSSSGVRERPCPGRFRKPSHLERVRRRRRFWWRWCRPCFWRPIGTGRGRGASVRPAVLTRQGNCIWPAVRFREWHCLWQQLGLCGFRQHRHPAGDERFRWCTGWGDSIWRSAQRRVRCCFFRRWWVRRIGSGRWVPQRTAEHGVQCIPRIVERGSFRVLACFCLTFAE